MGSCVSRKEKVIQVRKSIANMGTRITLLDRFGATQAKLLLDAYNRYSTKSGLELRSFQKMFPQLSEFPSLILASMFKIFDIDNSGFVSFSNFCVTVSQYLIGHRSEKCKFLFRVFDTNSNGILEAKELVEFRKYIKRVLRQDDTAYSRVEAEESVNAWKKLTLDEFVSWSLIYLDFHKALIPFEVIPSPNSEKEIIKPLLQEEMKEGETWYLISTPWLETWKNYVNFDKTPQLEGESDQTMQALINMRSKSILPGSRPVEINNLEFRDPKNPGHISHESRCPEDYTPIHPNAWKEFICWYGGGPEFPRTVIKSKNGKLLIDLFPIIFKIYVSSQDIRTIMVSDTKYIMSILNEINGEGKGRLYWDSKNGLKILKKDKLISHYFTEKVVKLVYQDVEHEESTPLLKEFIEIDKNFEFSIGENVEYEEDGQWLSGFIKEITEFEFILGAGWRSKTVVITKTESFRIRKPSRLLITSSRILNATGLVNLGNTCYMNSIIQCLNNTPLFSKFFALGSYLKLVNRDNPEGSHGEVSRVFGNLLRNLSSGTFSRVRPYEFFNIFSNIYTLFQGNDQQDAHEFLRILLDSLHEDLNRNEGIKTSKTITLNNPELELEKQSSLDHWQKIQGNIGSVISDLCGGQSRNKIQCKRCENQVIIFELLMDLSLPIPIATPEISVFIHFFKKTLDICHKFKFNLKNDSDSQVLISKIIKTNEFKMEDLVFFIHKNRKLVEISKENLNKFFKAEIFAFEICTKNEEIDSRGEVKDGVDWRERIVKGDFLDFNTGSGWVIGQVREVLRKEFEIFLHYQEGEVVKVEKLSPLLSPLRSQILKGSSIFTAKLYHRRVINKDFDTFGLPLVLSLGSWLTLNDLRNILEDVVYEYTNIARIRDLVGFSVFSPNSICAFCKISSCTGCEIPKTYQSILSLPDQFFISLLWKSFIMYKPKLREHQEIEDISIYNCLQEYSREENIEFNCSKCQHKECTSKTNICKLPDLLIIHLKRFRFEGNNPTKINNKIEFPLNTFDLNSIFVNNNFDFDYTQSNAKDNNYYDLFAVVNHSGNVYGGHYTCSCLVDNGGEKKWLYYDDDQVYELQGNIENEIVTRKAYILFYKRQRMSSSSLIQLSNYY